MVTSSSMPGAQASAPTTSADLQPAPNERDSLLPSQSRPSTSALPFERIASISFNSRLGSLVLMTAGTLLLVSTMMDSAKAKFGCFVAFEVAVGMYCESVYVSTYCLRSPLTCSSPPQTRWLLHCARR